MNTNSMTSPYRKLPSFDWLAVGLATVGFILGRLHFPWSGLFGLAVFGPFLFRELGWLKDSDEWQRGIMHRAGFHTMLAMALFVFLNRVLPRFQYQYPEMHDGLGTWFNVHFLWQTLVLVFLVSYLLQYWGAAKGVSRVLIGFACVQVIEISIGMARGPWNLAIFLAFLGIAGLILLLAWFASRYPRPAGFALLAIMLFTLVLSSITFRDLPPDMVAGMVGSQVYVILLFGVTGAALLHSEKGEIQ